MSLELVNTLATFGTFLVIAATGIAAMVQLRHMRSSNQIAVLRDLYEKRGSPEMVSAIQFMHVGLIEKMQDPSFRYQVAHRSARTDENAVPIEKATVVGNFYEEMGVLTKSGFIDRELLLDIHGGSIVANWDALSEFTAVTREARGAGIWENFEYLTVLAQDWDVKYPSTYPANTRRIDLPNRWLEADKQYAASLALA
jgi:hypothetical protein